MFVPTGRGRAAACVLGALALLPVSPASGQLATPELAEDLLDGVLDPQGFSP